MTTKYSGNYSSVALVLVGLLALTGCAAPARVQTLVPVPVECRETVPERPMMPTEALSPGVSPWSLLRAALAEIDRREGHELQLREALLACSAPVL